MAELIPTATEGKNGLMPNNYLYKKVSLTGSKVLHFQYSLPNIQTIDAIFQTSNESFYVKASITNWNSHTVNVISTSGASTVNKYIKMAYDESKQLLHIYFTGASISYILHSHYGIIPIIEIITDLPPSVKDVTVIA